LYRKEINISNIHLIDAGYSALNMGKGYLENFFSDSRDIIPNIKVYNQFLNCSPPYLDNESDLQTIEIHFFSNMLDVQGINIEMIASYINDNMNKSIYIFCAGPNYSFYNLKLNDFYRAFQKTGMVTIIQNYCVSINTLLYKFNSGRMCYDNIEASNLVLQLNRK